MGRFLLIAAVLVLVGCSDETGAAPETPADSVAGATPQIGVATAATAAVDTAHADVACAGCHAGPQGERGRATVPASSCAASGCHLDHGPVTVQLATATFEHRNHAAESEIQPSCAGCHTHGAGGEPLRASVDACALCHIGEVSGTAAEECRTCHQQPRHATFTSQGVAVSHSALPWIELGCVRCHYDVADPPVDVAPTKCRDCHDQLDDLNARAVGRDLHPIHSGVTCTACHIEGTHHVRAMSSAVELVCSDCHQEVHEASLRAAAAPGPAVCAGCHANVHRAQQQLLLGIAPQGPMAPSTKFLSGITCRSCHIPPPPGTDPTEPIRGQATACAGCHAQEFARVLDWWLEGLRTRLGSTTAFVERAARDLAASGDSVAELVTDARQMVGLVADAGGQHNLELSDRLFREAVQRVELAYRVAGRTPPAAPDLGRVPHAGLCTYCHYGERQPWNFEAMPERFHESVLRRGQ